MRKILLILLTVLMGVEVQAQNITVKGKVLDASDGEGLPGAYVKIEGAKGGTAGAVTDYDGNFTISAAKNASLTFSMVGYSNQTVKVNGRTSLTVRLATDSKLVDEVVVVGYGTMKKSDVSGAASRIGEEALKGSIITNIDQSLQGRVSGVTAIQTSGAPGSSSSIRVRGQATINANAEPLYVIDGVIYNNTNTSGSSVGLGDALGNGTTSSISPLSTINPQDIVSMEILKDASATAIYGAQGANGVVLITTKRGKAGEAKFSYSGMVAWQYQGKRLDILNLRDFAEYYNDFVDNGWGQKREELSDPSLLGKGTNWQDAIFQTALQHSHQISAEGGSDIVKYYVSGNYMDQDGTLRGSSFKRYGLRANMDAQLKPWLKLGLNTSYSNTDERLLKADQDEGIIKYALVTAPDIPIYDINGEYTSVSREGVTTPNPVALALLDDIRLKKNSLVGNVFAEVTFFKGLVWHTELGYNFNWDRASTFKPTYDFGSVTRGSNSASLQKNTGQFLQYKNYLTYNGSIKKHSFTAMVGQEAWESKWDFNSTSNTNLPSDAVNNPALGAGTPSISAGFGSSSMASFFTRETYNYDNRYLLTYTFRLDGSSNFGPDERWASFHSVAGSWRFTNEKFMKGITKVLNDGKLRLGWGQTGNSNIGGYKWGTSMSKMPTDLGLGYRQSNIENLKIHWEKQEQFNVGLDLNFFNSAIQLTVDAYLKKSNDMLMKMQLPSYMGTSGNVSSALAAPYGNYGKIENRGFEVSLKAHPVRSKDFSWDTDVEFSYNKNKLKALAGTGSAAILGYGQWTDVVSKTDVGQPLYQFYGYVTDGIYTSLEDIENSPKPVAYNEKGYDRSSTVWVGDIKYKDLTGDGKITEDDRTYIGNPMPKFTFGWTNTFNYKNFDLSIFIAGSVGNKVFNYLRRSLDRMNDLWTNQLTTVKSRAVLAPINPNKDYSNGYQGKNSKVVWHWYDDIENVQVVGGNGSMPRGAIGDPNENFRISDRYVEDGSYLRMKNISLGYTFPQKWIKPLGLSNLRLYANIQNLFTITGYDGYDPEVGASSADANGYVYGLDNGRYPSPTTYSFGINVSF